MESMVEENGSAVDPLSPGSQSGDAAPAIGASVQSLSRTHQQQTHHLVASTSIVQLTLPASGTAQVYRSLSCVSHWLFGVCFLSVLSALCSVWPSGVSWFLHSLASSAFFNLRANDILLIFHSFILIQCRFNQKFGFSVCSMLF